MCLGTYVFKSDIRHKTKNKRKKEIKQVIKEVIEMPIQIREASRSESTMISKVIIDTLNSTSSRFYSQVRVLFDFHFQSIIDRMTELCCKKEIEKLFEYGLFICAYDNTKLNT